MILRVEVVLRRTVVVLVVDWRFDNLGAGNLVSQELTMTSAQVFETSVNHNDSPCQDYPHMELKQDLIQQLTILRTYVK